MKISKAILTIAKPDQRSLPLQRLVDREGIEKSALQLNLDEIAGAGIDDICVIVGAGNDEVFHRAAGEHAKNVQFIQQTVHAAWIGRCDLSCESNLSATNRQAS